MKRINKPTEKLPSIDTVNLADVTGGCAACGQNCAAGAAPQQPQAGGPLRNLLGRR